MNKKIISDIIGIVVYLVLITLMIVALVMFVRRLIGASTQDWSEILLIALLASFGGQTYEGLTRIFMKEKK